MFDVYSRLRSVDSKGVGIAVTDHGAPDGVPVLLIHGFPDSARLWRNQVPVLVEAGCRVLAPDLRGYGRSDKPAEIEDYEIGLLAGDMLAVLEAAGVESAHVVGHDWGGALAWYLAITSPERVRSLIAISVGHPTAFQSAGYRQLEKSWYMLLFQFPEIAEEWLSQDDWKNMRGWTHADSEVANWIQDLSRPGALTAALGVYRANMGPERLLRPPRKLPPVTVPVMGVWSTGDFALLESQMTGSAQYVRDEFRYERVEDASHWIPVEAPETLNGLLVDWLSSH